MSDRGDRSASEERPKSRSPDENGRKDRSRSKSRSKSHKAHSYSRSRSRSRSHSWSRSKSHSSHSRSRSRSRSRNSRRKSSRSRSRSPYYKRRSPMSKRKRHYGSRDDPPKSNCLGIFGLSLYTTERDLKEFLEKYGTVSSCQLVYDHQSGRSRGFAFAYFPDCSEAEKVKEETSGLELDGRRIRVDYSITQRAHTPTPGVYMGKPSQSRDMDKGKRFHNRRSDDFGSRDNYSRDRYRERDYGSRDYGSRDTYSSRDRDYYSRSRSRSPRRY